MLQGLEEKTTSVCDEGGGCGIRRYPRLDVGLQAGRLSLCGLRYVCDPVEPVMMGVSMSRESRRV